MCLGFFPLGYGLVHANLWLGGLGILWLIMGLFAWIIEPVTEGDDEVGGGPVDAHTLREAQTADTDGRGGAGPPPAALTRD